MPADSELAKKTVGQLIGVDKAMSLPGMDELNYLVDQMDSAFSSLGIDISRKRSAKKQSTPSDVDKQGLAGTQDQCMKSMPPELVASTQSPLGVPMKVLLGLPSEVWSFSSSVCDPVLKWIESEASGALEDAKDLLRGRLSVPVLTDLIETVVLQGRKLNLLTLAALAGSIPMTLMGASGDKSTKSTATGLEQKSTEKSQDDTDEEALRWLLFSISLVNTILIGARAALEYAEGSEEVEIAKAVLYAASGAFTLTTASVDLYFASKLQSQQAKDIGIAHGCFGLAQGVWLCVLAGVQEGAETIDAVIEIVLGLAELATTIASVILGVDDPSALSVLGFRLSSWTLWRCRRCSTGWTTPRARMPAPWRRS